MKMYQLLRSHKKGFRQSFTQLLLGTALLLSVGNKTNAQIMYHDINPDISCTTAMPSITQVVSSTTFSWYTGGPYTSNAPGNAALVMVTPGTGDGIIILNQGDMIGSTNSWNVDAYVYTTGVGATNKYLGFRISTGVTGSYYYGWFLADLATSGAWTIKAYGYQQTANTAIAAGDMGSGTTNVAVTSIAVNGPGGASTITTNQGTLQMSATVTPANATNSAVTWSVQNGTGSGTISTAGLLTAQTNGTVTVKATAQDGSNVIGTKTITISGQTTANVAVTGIAVNGQGGASTITTNHGTLQMAATVTPANATNPAVTWSVQNGTGSGTISTTGLLTAQANGTVTVKATAQDGSNVVGTKAITISGQTGTGIADINKITSVCYPNPVHQELLIQFETEETIHNICIHNLIGQVVYNDKNIGKGKVITINTASLPEGMYILTFENAEGKQGLQKFTKGN